MGLGPKEIGDMIGQYTGPVFSTVGFIVQVLIVVAVLYWFYVMWKFDTKLLIEEMGKRGRALSYETRAREFIDKKTKLPKLRMFGILGFWGETIAKPPAECITPYKSRLTNRFYKFVKKDGLYYPIENFILGRRYKDDNGKDIYSIQGSGLEISRDYNAEDAIMNRMETAAHKYRNKDSRNQMYLGYGLMIVSFIVAGVIMAYTINKIGGLNTAIESLGPHLKQAAEGALASKIGPG